MDGESVDKAMLKQGTELDGRTLRIDFSKSRAPRRGGFGGGDGGRGRGGGGVCFSFRDRGSCFKGD